MLFKKLQNRFNSIVRNAKDLIRKNQQEKYFKKHVDINATRLIVFLIEGPWQKGKKERISGGITSIESIYQRTREMKSLHKAETILCILSGNRLYKFTTFNSKSRIVGINHLYDFKHLKEVLFHIPEYLVKSLVQKLEDKTFTNFIGSKISQLNILNQNIELMAEPAVIHGMKKYFSIVTQTTAHKNYNKDEFLEKYNIPYHFFSARVDIDQYHPIPFNQKKNLVLFSPDDYPKNKAVLDLLSKTLPGYKFQTIEKMSYEKYKERIGMAKFVFTFGEGLDGYFIESFFSGTISFAIYNEQFFRSAYKGLPSVFNNEDDLFSTINNCIQKFLIEENYSSVVQQTNALLITDYNYNEYVSNIKAYYNTYFKCA